MKHLFEKLREDTLNWRNEGYPCPDYPLIGEILRYQFEGEPPEQISLKYLREPQFQSLELYWFLRLVQKTPHIVDLYTHYYSDDKRDFFEAFGIPVDPAELQWIPDVDSVIEKVKNDPEFVRQKRIDPRSRSCHTPVSELYLSPSQWVLAKLFSLVLLSQLNLRWPSVILMSEFMRNALVFAPGHNDY